MAALVRDAGSDRDVLDRAAVLRTGIEVTGLAWLIPILETALAFHHAARGEQDDLTATIRRLREATATGDFAYYAEIAHFMAGRPLTAPSTTQWLDTDAVVRERWHALVTVRRRHPQTTR